MGSHNANNVCVFRLPQGDSREVRDVVPMCRVHIGHRISSRRHRDSAEHLRRTNTGAQQQQQLAAAATTTTTTTQNPAWNDSPGMSELQCPQCLATFSDTDAAEYLRHCEECATL